MKTASQQLAHQLMPLQAQGDLRVLLYHLFSEWAIVPWDREVPLTIVGLRNQSRNTIRV